MFPAVNINFWSLFFSPKESAFIDVFSPWWVILLLLAILKLQLMQKKLRKSQLCRSEHFIRKVEYQTKSENKCTLPRENFTNFWTIGWLQLNELAVPKSDFKTLLHQRASSSWVKKTHRTLFCMHIYWCTAVGESEKDTNVFFWSFCLKNRQLSKPPGIIRREIWTRGGGAHVHTCQTCQECNN